MIRASINKNQKNDKLGDFSKGKYNKKQEPKLPEAKSLFVPGMIKDTEVDSKNQSNVATSQGEQSRK